MGKQRNLLVCPPTVISGGQTGADQAGLRAAADAGLPTGGTAPKGWRTQAGPAPWLGTDYGLKEDTSSSYRPRTIKNVRVADMTIVFDKSNGKSPGSRLTIREAEKRGKVLLVNPTKKAMKKALREYDPATINIAGNREESHPGIHHDVRRFLRRVFLSVYGGDA